ncbi:hypothetical protein NST33_02450 [Paenibacillus sp. FSL L8-0435]|uniref:hypothetical protein n=1 Tax=Paenibacillus sp. FSL L8-0435 TaxID=2954618 RepID=UPI0030DA4D4D
MPEIQRALTQRRETAIVVEGTVSILKKRSVRLCIRISTIKIIDQRNLETTAIRRTIRNRNGHSGYQLTSYIYK